MASAKSKKLNSPPSRKYVEYKYIKKAPTNTLLLEDNDVNNDLNNTLLLSDDSDSSSHYSSE